MQIAAREIVLWTTPSEPPKALQASECSELLDPMRASCLILAQHQPGKFRECCSGTHLINFEIVVGSALFEFHPKCPIKPQAAKIQEKL